MSLHTHPGSCHCGAVRFEADIDLEAGTHRCNCSYCWKARVWFAFARGPGRFRILEGQDGLTTYRWTPPNLTEPFLTYAFCSQCGVRVFATAELEQLGGEFHAVPISTLDDLSPQALAELPIDYIDQRHDRLSPPEITSYL